MGDKAVNTDTQTKLQALKSAVKCFYEILARLDTTEVCSGDAPSGGTSSEVQIRFGFVPYDMNVNVGHLLQSDWFVDDATYQGRELTTVTGLRNGYTDVITAAFDDVYSANKTEKRNTQAECETATVADSLGKFSTAISNSEGVGSGMGIQTGSGTWQANQTVTQTRRKFISFKGTTCTYQIDTQTITRTWNFIQAPDGTADGVVFNAWRYKPVSFNVAQMKDGTAWKAGWGYTIPTLAGGTSAKVWDGCIEERGTVRQASYTPIPAQAYDLQIDTPPTSTETKWKPALRYLTFPRKLTYDNSANGNPDGWTADEMKTFNTFSGQGYSCPLEAKLLQTWPDATAFENYVDSMVKGGNTYHDIGMVWGARLLSPNGLFKATNELTPKGGQIQRHLIFMTDGDACTENYNYQAYGISWYERRQTDPAVVPTSGCSADKVPGTLADQVDARTQALCTAVKNMKDTTLWVIWFGAKNTKIEGLMTACASPDRYFAARNSTDLQNTFRQIANQISQLRVTN